MLDIRPTLLTVPETFITFVEYQNILIISKRKKLSKFWLNFGEFLDSTFYFFIDFRFLILGIYYPTNSTSANRFHYSELSYKRCFKEIKTAKKNAV
jgi:hypothetical protein